MAQVFSIPRLNNFDLKADVSVIYTIYDIKDKIDKDLFEQMNVREITEYVTITPGEKKLCVSKCVSKYREGHVTGGVRVGIPLERAPQIDFIGSVFDSIKENSCKTNRYSKNIVGSKVLYDWDKCKISDLNERETDVRSTIFNNGNHYDDFDPLLFESVEEDLDKNDF